MPSARREEGEDPQGHGVLPAGQGMELEAGRLCHWAMCIPMEDFSMLSSGRSCAFRYSAFEGKPLILFPGKSPWQWLLLLHPHSGCFAEHCLPPTPLQDSRVRPERSPLCQQRGGGKAPRAGTSSGLWRTSQLTDSQESSVPTTDGKLLSPPSSLHSTLLPSQLPLCLPG